MIEQSTYAAERAAAVAPNDDGRWIDAGTARVLIQQAQYGGATLGTVTRMGMLVYHWTAGAREGRSASMYAAQRAVRRALREGKRFKAGRAATR